MKRRAFIAGLLVAATLGHARAQQPAKVYRIAFVTVAVPIAEITETSSFPYVRAFFHELRRFGYVEGRNLIVERYPVEQPTVELARDVVRSKPDLIFAVTHAWVQLLKPLTATIPIVATMADPVGFGFVASLAHPGGNITGASVDAGPEIVTKRLELLKEAFPQASRVGVLAARGSGGNPYSEQLQKAAQRLGLLLLVPRLEGTLQEIEHRRFFEVMAQEHADSLYVVGNEESWVYRRLMSSSLRRIDCRVFTCSATMSKPVVSWPTRTTKSSCGPVQRDTLLKSLMAHRRGTFLSIRQRSSSWLLM
jgi:putative tryptophan/tyrosine transport system substrate-binding protein